MPLPASTATFIGRASRTSAAMRSMYALQVGMSHRTFARTQPVRFDPLLQTGWRHRQRVAGNHHLDPL
jgi:hypothetical protein